MIQAGDHAQLHFWRDANRALTPQVVLEAQLGSVSPTLLTEGVRALNWADTIYYPVKQGVVQVLHHTSLLLPTHLSQFPSIFVPALTGTKLLV